MDEDDAMWDEVGISDETIESLLNIEVTTLGVSGQMPPQREPEAPNFTSFALENALSPEQRAILELVKSGRNIFFTGSAGMQNA